VGEMAFSLFAANEGHLDKVPVSDIVKFEKAMHAYINDKYADLVASINANGNFNDEIAADMTKAIEDFKANGAY
jgi:F-type H+-transporting ATPase subunit alpha